MSKQSEEFFRVMLEFLPSTKDKYRESIEEYGLLLETIVIEDIFMPDIIKLISENKDIKLLEDLFNYFEEVSNSEDEHLINIFSITVLEILGNDKQILKVAQKYMGPKTTYLQSEADRSLGRN
jgi:F0F1-type ATP synthase delta subunit